MTANKFVEGGGSDHMHIRCPLDDRLSGKNNSAMMMIKEGISNFIFTGLLAMRRLLQKG